MKEITLDDYLLEAMASITKNDAKALIENLEINLTNKFKRSSAGVQASDVCKKIIGIYGGIYGAMKSKMKDARSDVKNEDEFLRAYWAYVAAEGCLDILGKVNTTTLVRTAGLKRMPVDFNLTLNSTDQNTLVDVLKHFYKFVINSASPESVTQDIRLYFEFLSNYARERMEEPLLSRFRDQYKDIVVIGKNFKVDGIKERKKPARQSNADYGSVQDSFKKGLEEITLDPVRREEIVGNQGAIELVETEVPCLMHYDPKEKRNPFRGFQQYLMFVGKSGAGKTMLARYAMTAAKEIADKCQKPVSLVKLNFEDKFQCGPLDNIRNQLTEICEGNRVYIVFIDEIDTKIPSRTGNLTQGYKNDVIGEFLRFRGGGDYINKGNYIVIATSNEPSEVDPAILRVFNVQELPGAVTPSEKVKILYNNLLPGIRIGYVQVADDEWETIGKMLAEYGLMGGDIVNIASEAEQKYRKIASRLGDDSYTMGATLVESKVGGIIAQGNFSDFITTGADIIQSIMRQAEKAETVKKSYLGKRSNVFELCET